jgi:predicted deacetylase
VRPRRPDRTIAVAVHGIEPASFERCALIRDWLDDHGVERVTLLVIPARDLHPVGTRSPEMVSWLEDRRRRGDAIAQHGFQHVPLRPGPRLSRSRHGEFAGLDSDETRRAVHSGWRVLKLAGIEPDGFVAPAYAYTPALRRTLGERFRWWASLLRVHPVTSARGARIREPLVPAWSLAGAGPLRRSLSPPLVRAASLVPTQTLRLDVHPADLRNPRHMLALEWVLSRSGPRRTSITYEELAYERMAAAWRPMAGGVAG